MGTGETDTGQTDTAIHWIRLTHVAVAAGLRPRSVACASQTHPHCRSPAHINQVLNRRHGRTSYTTTGPSCTVTGPSYTVTGSRDTATCPDKPQTSPKHLRLVPVIPGRGRGSARFPRRRNGYLSLRLLCWPSVLSCDVTWVGTVHTKQVQGAAGRLVLVIAVHQQGFVQWSCLETCQ